MGRQQLDIRGGDGKKLIQATRFLIKTSTWNFTFLDQSGACWSGSISILSASTVMEMKMWTISKFVIKTSTQVSGSNMLAVTSLSHWLLLREIKFSNCIILHHLLLLILIKYTINLVCHNHEKQWIVIKNILFAKK